MLRRLITLLTIRRTRRPPTAGQRWDEADRRAAQQRILDQARRNSRWPA